jgi:hypothetical protein
MNLTLRIDSRKVLTGALAAVCLAALSGACTAKTPQTTASTVSAADDAEKAENLRQLKIALAREESERRARSPQQQRHRGSTTPMTTEELRSEYAAKINREIRKRWNAKSAPPLVKCKLMFEQIPGGEVIRIAFLDCPYERPARESIERALRLRQLPYSGYEDVFSRQVTLTLCMPEKDCAENKALR